MKTAQFEISGYAPLLNLVDTDNVSSFSNKNFIPFGEDNLFPQQIAHISREVALHRALLNSKSFYIAGKDFISNNSTFSKWLSRVNNQDETLKDVFYKLIFDELNMGNSYFEIVTDSRKSFVQIYHVDAITVRLTSDKKVILHPDWSNYKGVNDKKQRVIALYPRFTKDGKFYRSVFHLKQYENQFYYYGIPSWYSGIRSIIIAGLTNIWNQTRLENQFNASGLLIIPGVNTEEEAAELELMFENYKGYSKVAKLLKYYLADKGPGETRELAQYLEFKKNEEGNWLQLHQQAQSELITIHNWFKSLCSFVENTGFDSNRIINEYNIALNTVIKVHQQKYINVFKKVLSLFAFDVSDLSVINESPVELLHPLKYIWELRRDMGLPFDKSDPKQCLFYQELKNTYGNNLTQ
ncbi:MAG: hypothetical protein HOG34_00775 [Bacteroidetes bacterium]|jgi:hypothetical protein|nr:hypothetical protein [Bacteroidota bacterium]